MSDFVIFKVGGIKIMNKKLELLFQQQANNELYSAYLYFKMAKYYQSLSLDGFSNYFLVQAKEEVEHADKFIEFLIDKGIEVEHKDIKAHTDKFKSIKDPLLLFVSQEIEVTKLIENIYRNAREVDDLDALNFLNWFINEQHEEEKISTELLQKYETLAENDKAGLYELNKELTKRTE